jgi:hypothetical protein
MVKPNPEQTAAFDQGVAGAAEMAAVWAGMLARGELPDPAPIAVLVTLRLTHDQDERDMMLLALLLAAARGDP